MSQNVLVVHGGGPTAVINASLYGVIEEAKRNSEVGKVYGAIGGTGAIFSETFIDLTSFDDEKLKLLLHTPASAIGSSRYPLYEKDYEKMVDIFKKHDIKYVLLNGGNGTMDACGHIYEVCKDQDIKVVGIPKTIDNDIAMTDHSPGYGSAARFIAASTQEDEFLEDVSRLQKKQGGVVVLVSEGLHDANGESIVPPIFKSERAVYYGDVSSHLANLVVKKLGVKARSEKPGLCGRASVALQSPVDREEARQAGTVALRSAVEGNSGVMVGFERVPGTVYQMKTKLVPIKEVMLYERKMPDNFINERGNDVTQEFVDWCRPLIGDPLPEFLNFKDYL